jgi:hypothetical protein
MEKKFGNWVVLKTGDMTYDNNRYDISSDQLNEEDWILHLLKKEWIDWNEFIPAYFYALSKAGIKSQIITISY